MLLSEILQIAKKLKSSKYINESYKANIIRLLINPINTYTKYNISGNIDSKDYLLFLYIKLYKTGNPDLVNYFNNPNYRKHLLKLYLYKNYTSFITDINSQLKNNTNIQIDIANITDDLIEVINDITLVKKKPYKSSLQFWVNSNTNLLIAITHNNKIICICIHYSDDGTDIPINNPNFYGEYTLDDCKKIIEEYNKNNNYTLMNEFLGNAYKFIKKYSILTSEKSIKKELNTPALSINKLIEYFRYNSIYDITVYSVNSEGMETNDITEKMELREQYKKYLHYEKHYLLHLRDRYKQIINEIKGKKLRNEKQDKLKAFLNLCLDSYLKSIDIYIEYLNKPINELSLTDHKYGLYMSLNNDKSKRIVYSYIRKNHASNKLFNTIINRFMYLYGRGKVEYKTFSAENKVDLILYCSILILLCIDIVMKIFTIYNEIDNITDNQDIIVRKLAEAKLLIEDLNYIKCDDKHTFTLCIYDVRKENIKDLDNILTDISNYKI